MSEREHWESLKLAIEEIEVIALRFRLLIINMDWNGYDQRIYQRTMEEIKGNLDQYSEEANFSFFNLMDKYVEEIPIDKNTNPSLRLS